MEMVRYGMVIDLKRCVRCRTCYVACKVISKIPTQFDTGHKYHRLWYEEWEEGEYPVVTRFFLPMQCMQCEDAPCIEACGKEAIYIEEDGVVVINTEKCADCENKDCIPSCPYNALYLNYERDVVDKCDFCSERVKNGLLPYCVEMCPAEARFFGDLENPESRVSRIIAQRKAKHLLPELGTKPKVYYVPFRNETDPYRLSRRILRK